MHLCGIDGFWKGKEKLKDKVSGWGLVSRLVCPLGEVLPNIVHPRVTGKPVVGYLGAFKWKIGHIKMCDL